MFDHEHTTEVTEFLSAEAQPDTFAHPELTIARADVAERAAEPDGYVPIVPSADRRPDARRDRGIGSIAGGASLSTADGETGNNEAYSLEDRAADEGDKPAAGTGSGSDVPPAHPPETALSSPEGMPDPREVASRVAAVTGLTIMHLGEPQAGERQTAFFSVANDGTAGIATVSVERLREVAEEVSGESRDRQPVLRPFRKATQSIGHYDPAAGAWRLYPEFVWPEERESLNAAFETAAQTHTGELREAGRPMVDLRDELTVAARQHMAIYLQEGDLARKLLERAAAANNMSLVFDEGTSATLGLSPRMYGPGIGAQGYTASGAELNDPAQYGLMGEQILTVEYRGIRTSEDGHTKRVSRLVHIADRSLDDEQMWLPDPNIITIDEWDGMSEAPRMLLAYGQVDPNFSTMHCAVTRNQPKLF